MEDIMDKYEIQHQEESWKITNDQECEWSLLRLKEDKAEMDRFIDTCEKQIKFYQEKIKLAKEQHDNRTGFLKSKLLEYFMTVPHKATKTQETYSLPSGKLKLKYPKPDYVRDEEKLVEWLKKMGHTEYVKTVETPVWGEFKKTTKTHKEPITDEETGEITGYETYVTDAKGIKVGGITLEEKPPIFEVKV